MKDKLLEGWKEVELGGESICEIAGEYGSGASAVEYNEAKPRYLRITDINEDGTLKKEKVSPNLVEEKYFLEKGDLLFARSGATVGKTYLFNGKEGKSQYAGYLIRYRFNKKIIDPRYVYYYTKTPSYLSWVQSRMKVVAQPNINAKQYSSIKIILPPLPVQQKIVSILEKAESLKQKREEADRKTKKYLQSVFVEMFGRNRFPKVEIRKGVLKIDNINLERDHANEYFDYVDIASVDNSLKKIINTKKILGKEAPSRAKQVIKYKDVLISTVRPNLNAVASVPKELDNQICSTGFCILRADNKNFLPEYLSFISRNSFFVNELVSKCKGANYPAVSNNDVWDVSIPLPPFPLQQKFAKIVEKVEALKEKQKQSKEKIDNLFNSLMQKAFKGELEK